LIFCYSFRYTTPQMAFTPINGVCGGLTLASLAFFIVTSIGYSDGTADIQYTAWFAGTLRTPSGSGKFYAGLRCLYDKVDDAVVSFGGTACSAAFCNECERDGDSAFALIIVAILFSFIELVSCFAYTVTASVDSQLIQMVVAFVSAVFSLVSVAIFMKGCYKSIGDSAEFDDLYWGPSSILATMGTLMMWAVVFIHVVGAVDAGYPAVGDAAV
jgi:hypothetical protein